MLLFQRDYHCTNCRKQVQQIASRYDEFRNRKATVVSVLPEPVRRIQRWQEQYDLPFPLLADESKTTGEQYDQPIRFGILGSLHYVIERMPEMVIIDARSDEFSVGYVHRGRFPADRLSVDDILEHIDKAAVSET